MPRSLNALVASSKLMQRMPAVANVVISNVPGPQVPLYLAGAEMKTFFPVSIITHGLALNITVQTYCGNIDFGIIACKVAVPDLNDLGTAIKGGFDELVALAQAKIALDKERDAAAPAEAAPAPAVKKRRTAKTSKTANEEPIVTRPSSKRSSASR